MTTATSKLQIIIDIIGDKTASSSFDKMKSGIAEVGVAIGTLAAAGYTAKKAWDFAQEGAAVAQTAESFDLLLEKIGAAPDLLQQLDSAAGGTISKMELMSSTSTLLAGTSGSLATALANSTPQMLEIARAANKLNPSLGTTTQMYDSLALGIKRSSPLILDNLGLTIKVGDANSKYAAELGKSVAELTAAEKQQALLNETLRAGSVLIDQVGGNVASAADDYAKFNAEVQNLKDDASASLSSFFGPAVSKVNDARDAMENLDAMLASGQIGVGEYAAIWAKLHVPLTDVEVILSELIARQAEIASAQNITNAALGAATGIVDGYQQSMYGLSDAYAVTEMSSADYARTLSESNSQLDFYRMRSEEAAKASQVHGQYIRDNLEVTQDATLAQSAFNETLSTTASEFGSINTSMSNTIQSLIEQAQFLAAGGDTIVAATEAIKQSAQAGEIDFDEAANQLQAAGIAALDLEQELTDMPVEELTEKLMGLGLGPKEAETEAAKLMETLYAATSQEWLIDVIMNVQGELPSGVAPGTDSPVPEDTGGSEPIETAPGGGQTPQGGGVQVQVQQPLDVYQVADEVAKIMVR